MSNDIHQIESDMASLIQDGEARKLYLSMFLESLIEANSYGANKWGVYYRPDVNGLRLLVGSIIVLTLHKYGLWMALDRELLQTSEEEQKMLNLSECWQWDTDDYPEYTRVPSKNGFLTLSPIKCNFQIWSTIRRFHFVYIARVAAKFDQLRQDSQRKHMPEVLAYFRQELNRYVPEPVYDNATLAASNLLPKIKEFQSGFQYQSVPETERELIIQSRVGQGKFRASLVSLWGRCAVTDCQAIEILRASHIKPWRESSNIERLDVYNGLLLVPNLDIAFDNGFITFADDGEIIISDFLAEKDRSKLGIFSDMKISGINEKHRKYLKYHREKVFRKLVS